MKISVAPVTPRMFVCGTTRLRWKVDPIFGRSVGDSDHSALPSAYVPRNEAEGVKNNGSPELPQYLRDETQRRRRYPHLLRLTNSVDFKYRLRQREVGCIGQQVHRLELFGWLVTGKRRIGAVRADRYTLERCCDNRQFFAVMDSEGEYEQELAEALCSVWENVAKNVATFGPILDFNLAWIDRSQACEGLLCRCYRALTQVIFPEHSVVVLKAIPLRADARGPPPSEHLERRRAAMLAITPGFSGSDLYQAVPVKQVGCGRPTLVSVSPLLRRA